MTGVVAGGLAEGEAASWGGWGGGRVSLGVDREEWGMVNEGAEGLLKFDGVGEAIGGGEGEQGYEQRLNAGVILQGCVGLV